MTHPHESSCQGFREWSRALPDLVSMDSIGR